MTTTWAPNSPQQWNYAPQAGYPVAPAAAPGPAYGQPAYGAPVYPPAPGYAPQPYPSYAPPRRSNTALIVSLVVAAFLLVGGGVTTFLLLNKGSDSSSSATTGTATNGGVGGFGGTGNAAGGGTDNGNQGGTDNGNQGGTDNGNQGGTDNGNQGGAAQGDGSLDTAATLAQGFVEYINAGDIATAAQLVCQANQQAFVDGFTGQAVNQLEVADITANGSTVSLVLAAVGNAGASVQLTMYPTNTGYWLICDAPLSDADLNW